MDEPVIVKQLNDDMVQMLRNWGTVSDFVHSEAPFVPIHTKGKKGYHTLADRVAPTSHEIPFLGDPGPSSVVAAAADNFPRPGSMLSASASTVPFGRVIDSAPLCPGELAPALPGQLGTDAADPSAAADLAADLLLYFLSLTAARLKEVVPTLDVHQLIISAAKEIEDCTNLFTQDGSKILQSCPASHGLPKKLNVLSLVIEIRMNQLQEYCKGWRLRQSRKPVQPANKTQFPEAKEKTKTTEGCCVCFLKTRVITEEMAQKTCRCHGMPLDDIHEHKKKRSCPLTCNDLESPDIFDNYVKVGEQTVLFMPSFWSTSKLFFTC
ncbi:hypothetical protein POM88_051559 [Heracleum sosnowskyi]|uniref:Uncharacterized protein n=1 Tax=Heracleum sosnowskyi TaxID=360622 RepID=A0AAD8H239_9APIA|nr:hypothetical protein POM88_051559 [Heracleum sosnowskyi]